MKSRLSIAKIIPSAGLLFLALGSAPSQRPAPSQGTVPTNLPPDILRRIPNDHGASPWLLFRDPAHPGGPGLLIQSEPLPSSRATIAGPLIRAGDKVLVEEHTAHADADLDGTALAPARAGQQLVIRIRSSQRLVYARAVAAGRCQLLGVVKAPGEQQ